MKRVDMGWAAALPVLVLAGCYAPPPPPPQPPLVAVPGPGKTEDQFRADDAACRGPAQPPPVISSPAPAAAQAAAPVPADPPGVAYLRCMAGRGAVIEPLVPESDPALYGYYPAYPVYAGVDYGFPVFYGGFLGFGYGGYRGRYYGGGYYHGGGYYRGAYGYGHGGYDHGGGYGGGGFRGGGGFGGGFHGGGFGRGR